MKPYPLGFGVMRLEMDRDGTFPQHVPNLLAGAYGRGINYFDTAYPYLRGRSEELVRDALVKRFPRESFYIADKLPCWECRGRGDMERIFATQLGRLGTDYVDFYLLHGLQRSRWLDMREKGALDFLNDKKREGRIHKAGFSFHDTAEELAPILDAYDWDFAQLQINYYDWVTQRAKECYEAQAQRGIPCIVMEPVGGGRLAKMPERAENLLKAERPNDSVASWAIRFAAGLPNVMVTLSGMSDMQQLNDNLSVFKPLQPLSGREERVLQEVVDILRRYNTIPCTACGYCVDSCPKDVDIPQTFKRYNDHKQFENVGHFAGEYKAFVPERRRASNCISCGKCIDKCPQNIDIPQELKTIQKLLV